MLMHGMGEVSRRREKWQGVLIKGDACAMGAM